MIRKCWLCLAKIHTLDSPEGGGWVWEGGGTNPSQRLMSRMSAKEVFLSYFSGKYPPSDADVYHVLSSLLKFTRYLNFLNSN